MASTQSPDPAADAGIAQTRRVQIGTEQTSAVLEPATRPASRTCLFVCAHGAGGHMADRGMLALSAQLRARGIHMVRFNFLYREKGSGRPDPMPRLQECIATVATWAREVTAPNLLVIGGRSMGGRAASMLAAGGFACDGLLLLAYPLHPAGQPEKLRTAHLPRIGVPVLCLNGTRDSLCRQDLMERVVSELSPSWTMRWLDAADHSFHVLKASGRTDSEVLDEIGEASEAWLTALASRK